MKRYEASLLSTDIHVYLGPPSRPLHTGTFFIGQQQGRQAYIALRAKLLEVPEGNPMILTLPRHQLIDAAYADESLARLGEELVGSKYGERGLLLEGLEPDSVANLKAAIAWRRRKAVLLTVTPAGRWGHVGQLAPYLLDTLGLVAVKGQLTVGELSAKRSLRNNAASNRLNRLHQLRLVRREAVTTSNGLIHIYHFWRWVR
jgi:hypothetical protein